MGRQIVKQPNGKLAVWSTIVDNFILTDFTEEEYIDFRIKEESDRIRKEIPEIVAKLNSGKRVGYYDASWDSCIERIKEVHGDQEVSKILEGLEVKDDLP